MLSGSTFVKLFRSLLDWRWYKNGNTMRLFIHLILKANISDGYFESTVIKRGQLVTSRKTLSTELNLSEQAVRTALNHLKSTNEITIKGTPKFTIITIVNYDTYQSATNQSTNEQPTINQQSTNEQPQYKKNKEEKEFNKNNKIYNLSTSVDDCPSFDYQNVINSFNSICVSLPKVKKLTEPRKKKIKALQHHLGDMSIDEYFKMVERSDFLTGRAGTWNGCNFDWILNPTNLTKIVEGNYSNERQAKSQVASSIDDLDESDLFYGYVKGVDYF